MTVAMKKRNVFWLILLIFVHVAGMSAGKLEQKLTAAAPVLQEIDGQAPDTEDGKKIAITFDDGPNPNYTEKLLKGLKKRGVKATFFLLGEQVEEYPQIVLDIHEQGHLIGVHSYEHVNFGQIGDSQALEQVRKTKEAIFQVTGEYPDFIRPPYGCWKKELDEQIPLVEVLWDVDPCDWATTDADVVVQRILSHVEDGNIILMHDASKSSVQAALTVIDVLEKRGYEFVTVEELLLGY